MKMLANAFTMIPTNDLAESVAAYVEGGLEILWRPDEQTTLLGANQRACVMVENDSTEYALGAGPVLLVDSLPAIHPGTEGSWSIPPMDVPVGKYAALNCNGAILRYLELAERDDGIPHSWFRDPSEDSQPIFGATEETISSE